jgi:phage terminase large subunit-like protein
LQHTPDKIPAAWLDTLLLIPGYDCRLQADGYLFDTERAQNAIDFFPEVLRHVKGELAGQPFHLEPWQKAIIANLFGWVDPAGLRRYRLCFMFVGKKNGKSAFGAGILLYVMITDHEPGAEIYSAAASQKQAGIVYTHVAGMLKHIPELKGRFKAFGGASGQGQRSVVEEATNSAYKCLTSDADTADGANVHFALIDELHRHKKAELSEVLELSTAARRQPLVIYTTTSDFERESVCNTKQAYAEGVRDNQIHDPKYLPVLFLATPDDDWQSPATWAKANPNLGVSIPLEFFEHRAAICKDSPSALAEFKRLNLNIKTQVFTRWLDASHWSACAHGVVDHGRWRADQLTRLANRPCYAGLDLGSTDDTTALVLYFPSADEYPDVVLPWFWLPANGKWSTDRAHAPLYQNWIDQGLIHTTPGNAVDYTTIKDTILTLASQFEILELAADPWHAQQLQQQLMEEGLDVIEFRQGFASMNSPSKELERLVATHTLNHGGHPVLNWQAASVEVKTDPAANIKPVKPDRASKLKVDGIIALVMAIGRANIANDHSSVYEERGILTI